MSADQLRTLAKSIFPRILNRTPMATPYVPHTLRSPTAVVHLEYDPKHLAPVPSVAPSGEPCHWTRFVCISDTHSHAFPVPPGDVLLHSGDLTNTGTVEEFKKTMEWLYALPHPVKIVIAGNHDLPLHEGWYAKNFERWHDAPQPLDLILNLLKGPKAIKAGIVYLQDESYEFCVKEGGRKWSVYGSPWSPEFFNWAFNYNRDSEAAAHTSKLPQTDILLTHGPAAGILDQTRLGDLAGCDALRARLAALRPRLHLAGHIHEAHGAHIHVWGTGGAADGLPMVQPDTIVGAGVGGVLDVGDAPGEGAREATVFVNAANWPAGSNAWRPKHGAVRVPFAGPGFQPVVVDLMD